MDGSRPQQPPPSKPNARGLGGLYHGLQFGITAIAGLALGHWLDGRYLPPPLGTIGGLLAGAALGMYNLARTAK